MCDLPDAHEGPMEADLCENPEHAACVVGTVGCSSSHLYDGGCETY